MALAWVASAGHPCKARHPPCCLVQGCYISNVLGHHPHDLPGKLRSQSCKADSWCAAACTRALQLHGSMYDALRRGLVQGSAPVAHTRVACSSRSAPQPRRPWGRPPPRWQCSQRPRSHLYHLPRLPPSPPCHQPRRQPRPPAAARQRPQRLRRPPPTQPCPRPRGRRVARPKRRWAPAREGAPPCWPCWRASPH